MITGNSVSACWTLLSYLTLDELYTFHSSVRAVACQCLVMMAPNVQVCGDPIFAHAKWQSAQLYSHLQSINIELSLAGIGDSAKVHPNAPLGLKHILWFLLGNIG